METLALTQEHHHHITPLFSPSLLPISGGGWIPKLSTPPQLKPCIRPCLYCGAVVVGVREQVCYIEMLSHITGVTDRQTARVCEWGMGRGWLRRCAASKKSHISHMYIQMFCKRERNVQSSLLHIISKLRLESKRGSIIGTFLGINMIFVKLMLLLKF